VLCHLVPRSEDLRRRNLGPKGGLDDGFNCGLTVEVGESGDLMSKKEFHTKILTFKGFTYIYYISAKKIRGCLDKEIRTERMEERNRG